jgi:FkbM family methyltransferase
VKRSRLIIDVGMHDGGDTAFYLAKGFDVVAVEANPALAAAAQERFSDEIAAGRLRLFGVAIADSKGTMPLAVAEDMTSWSSLSSDFVRRNETHADTSYHYVDVRTVPFEEIVAEVGIPYYLKVDIEGMDMLCVQALRRFDERPDFVSVESNVSALDAPFERVFDELAQLWALGYRSFKYVNQRRHPEVTLPYPPLEGQFVEARFDIDDSGPFGLETPGRWLSVSRALVRAQALRVSHNAGGLGGKWRSTLVSRAYGRLRYKLGRPTGWYDLHASLKPRH